MLDIELNGTEPKHVERIKPSMSTGASGEINWTPSLLDYDVSLFYRGKQVTNEEFNELFLKQLYQGNYIADSLSELFKNHLGNAIYRTFTHTFNLKKSYTKVFTPAEWGTIHEDGYYYITIPAEEHGFLQSDEGSAVDNMNVDTEMYVLDSDGQFHEVMQVEVDTNNTVRLYTDDNTLAGFVVVRSNDKSYRLADDVDIDASDINGLHPVAISGRYQDLEGLNDVDGPITLINKLNSDILDIIEGRTVVPNAEEAVHADTTDALLLEGTIQGIPVSNIFETGSNYVKDATHAINADNATNATNATIAQYADTDTSKGTIEERLTRLGFKEESVSLSSQALSYFKDTSVVKCTRQGNYVNITLDLALKTDNLSLQYEVFTTSRLIELCTIPENFRPKEIQRGSISAQFIVWIGVQNANNYINFAKMVDISPNGVVRLPNGGYSGSAINQSYGLVGSGATNTKITLGYEAEPLI